MKVLTVINTDDAISYESFPATAAKPTIAIQACGSWDTGCPRLGARLTLGRGIRRFSYVSRASVSDSEQPDTHFRDNEVRHPERINELQPLKPGKEWDANLS